MWSVFLCVLLVSSNVIFCDESATILTTETTTNSESTTSETDTTTNEPTTTELTTTPQPCEPPTIDNLQVGSNSFNFTLGNSLTDKFSVMLFDNGPQYELLESCQQDNRTGPLLSGTTFYEFLNASPFYSYTIEVTALCTITNSSSIQINISTDKTKPDEISSFDFKELRNVFNDSLYQISWTAPCKINAESLTSFEFSFVGIYSENELLTHSSKKTVNANSTQKNYSIEVGEDLIKPSYNYTITYNAVANESLEGEKSQTEIQTEPGIPGVPKILKITPEDYSFLIEWQEPDEKRGKIISYFVQITPQGPDYPFNGSNNESVQEILTESVPKYQFTGAYPYSNYTIAILATTKSGNGTFSLEENTRTLAGISDPIENLALEEIDKFNDPFNASMKISFSPPINLRGPLEGYVYENNDETNETQDTLIIIKLEPEKVYKMAIYPKNSEESQKNFNFTASSGYPEIHENLDMISSNESYRAFVMLNKNQFDEKNGKIVYYSIIIIEKDDSSNETLQASDKGQWDPNLWPKFENECQSTPDNWQPFNDDSINEIVWTIGDEKTNQNCSKKLKDGQNYYLFIRAFTKQTWRRSKPLDFKTVLIKGSILGLALGLTFGLLAFACVASYIVYFLKFKKPQIKNKKLSNVDDTPATIPCKKFMERFDIASNMDSLKTQFNMICTKSKLFNFETSTAVLMENKRKNRYVNIVPFDDTRVKLKIDEDDDLASDYINASYIKGYSGKIEYIATQGPIRQTCKDFWKMVVQENVTIIAMVSQFIENEKEKCYQYVPNHGHTESYGPNLSVRCVSELHFGTFCVRMLQITKDTHCYNVTHMQYLEWPDFGVPDGTGCMLEFCGQIRERARGEGGLILVHCSAGVGRTGTLIATDILLQTIQDHRDINVFKTVLELRKQRINMVQTEKQYIFIHSCLKDSINEPSPVRPTEALYQNLQEIYNSDKQSVIPDDEETGF